MSTTTQGTVSLLRECAMILRDFSNRDPRDVDVLAVKLEIIAARAAEQRVAERITDALSELEPQRLDENWADYQLRAIDVFQHREEARRALAIFLRESGFDKE